MKWFKFIETSPTQVNLVNVSQITKINYTVPRTQEGRFEIEFYLSTGEAFISSYDTAADRSVEESRIDVFLNAYPPEIEDPSYSEILDIFVEN
ncbi:hypothetical protein LCGC14_1290620 [marine sediment metagenome]|uniref:Uncharacterized protein n=1 Tax=marine sediment metagenome TaxID=412755 RepID=A0A0F9LDI6_9ZZZZ